MKSLRKPLNAFFSALAVSALAAFGTTGCNTDAFCWDNCPGDTQNSSSSGSATGGAGGAGGGNLGGEGGCGIFGCMTSSSSGSGGPCTPTNGGIEICDKLDNDCNGKVDDSPDINFGSPKTCGTCDNNCYTKLLNADPTGIGCDWNMVPGTAGTCTCSKGCADGWYDLNSDCICEYYCVKNQNVTDDSLCNNKDDDCDNQIDEDVNLCTSTTDCGACGNNCVILNGTSKCESTAMPGQACTPANTKCAIATCDAGYYDLDGSAATGCEYKCDKTNAGIETCDGVDNDCDGLIDNQDDLSGDPKFNSFCRGDEPLYRGICGLIANAGTYGCVDAKWKCVGPNVKEPGQVAETCNGLDDDCDGSIDDNPTDVGMACGTSNVYPCQKGTMQCMNGNPMCVGAKEPAVEECDNVDNDCDGTIDDNVPGFGMPCGTSNVGACKLGLTQCQPGGVTACVGSVLPTTETCNMVDDDCDGTIDDVNGVGTACGQSNAAPCKFGSIQCVMGNLACVGNVDPKTETCNMIDDDCDGSVDENLPTQQCLPMGANPNLVYGGSSQCRRGTQACGGACTGYVGPSTEVCDAIDNDCDGMVDNNLTLGPCNVPVPPPMGATSPCKAGTFQCTSGVQTCQGSIGPTSTVDACGVDSNCDGALTGQPNLQTDVANCGMCGNNCYANAVHSVWSCTAGMCAFQGCENGYYDLDNNNTCEYACSYVSAAEACNGLDDNCNGLTDENIVNKPTPSQICGVSPTTMRPECTTNVGVTCVSGAWQCSFPAGVCPGGCSANDEICDALDNDCDGLVNENVANFGQPCASDDSAPGTQGACRTTGTYICNGNSATVCSAMKDNTKVTAELCDGVDNDCDGSIDETYASKGTNATFFVKPDVTKISANRWIYSYEASRPTATTITQGTGNGYQTSAPAGTTLDKTRACSVPNRLPWFNVTPTEVEQTCTAMGGFICATADWTTACQVVAATPCTWGYNTRGAACTSTYVAGTKLCNLGPSYDFNSMLAGDQDGLLPTGSASLPNCWADWSGLQGNVITDNKIFDITGNLREITKSGTTYPLVGGAYNTGDVNGAACNFTFYTTTNASFQLYDLGYRCCFGVDPRL